MLVSIENICSGSGDTKKLLRCLNMVQLMDHALSHHLGYMIRPTVANPNYLRHLPLFTLKIDWRLPAGW